MVTALKESANALRAALVDVVRLDKALTALQASKESPVAEIIPELQNELIWRSARLATNSGRSCVMRSRRWV